MISLLYSAKLIPHHITHWSPYIRSFILISQIQKLIYEEKFSRNICTRHFVNSQISPRRYILVSHTHTYTNVPPHARVYLRNEPTKKKIARTKFLIAHVPTPKVTVHLILKTLKKKIRQCRPEVNKTMKYCPSSREDRAEFLCLAWSRVH